MVELSEETRVMLKNIKITLDEKLHLENKKTKQYDITQLTIHKQNILQDLLMNTFPLRCISNRIKIQNVYMPSHTNQYLSFKDEYGCYYYISKCDTVDGNRIVVSKEFSITTFNIGSNTICYYKQLQISRVYEEIHDCTMVKHFPIIWKGSQIEIDCVNIKDYTFIFENNQSKENIRINIGQSNADNELVYTSSLVKTYKDIELIDNEAFILLFPILTQFISVDVLCDLITKYIL